MTTRKITHAPPDKARDIFDKILATSDNAAKTRERLFSDLQGELQLLANLQEQHLVPILRRHGMDELVQQTISDNEETSVLLTDLERMPKNSPEFLGKIAELRRVFQQHIRDDRKELLPAVLEVLSDEEAEAVVEKVEDDMAANDESKRIEGQRTREQVETVQQVASDLADTVRAGTQNAQSIAQAMQQAVQNSFGAFSELARRSTGQAAEMFSRPNGELRSLTSGSPENLKVLAHSNTVLVQGLQEVSKEWFELSQKRLQRNLEGLNALARCRTVNDVVAVQSSLFRDNLEQTFDNTRRIAELTIQVADEATRTVSARTGQPESKVSRAA